MNHITTSFIAAALLVGGLAGSNVAARPAPVPRPRSLRRAGPMTSFPIRLCDKATT